MSYKLIPGVKRFIDGTLTVNGTFEPRCSAYSFVYAPVKPDLNYLAQLEDDVNYESPKPPKDKDSWRQIKKSGIIKFTPLERSKSSTKYYAVDVPNYSFAIGWPSCTNASDGLGTVYASQVKAISSWTAVVTTRTGYLDDTLRDESVIPDVAKELNALRAKVVNSSVLTYDLLTDVSEAAETAKLILTAVKAVRHPLETFIKVRDSIQKRHAPSRTNKYDPMKMKKEIESAWMQFRYGIMPIYYSIQDISKLAKESGNEFKTDRAFKVFKYKVGEKRDPSRKGIYTYTREEVEIRISCIGKVKYDPAALGFRLFDQIGFNPFVTAWELVPLSFVADWFANIGDWVLAQTSGLMPGPQQRLFMQSIKTVRTTTTYLVVNYEWSAERMYTPGGLVKIGPISSNFEAVLSESRLESYSRAPFTAKDVELQWDVFFNWKRIIDSWCLLQRPFLTALRKLR